MLEYSAVSWDKLYNIYGMSLLNMQEDVSTQADMLLAVLLPKWLTPVPDTEANTRFCNGKTMYDPNP